MKNFIIEDRKSDIIVILTNRKYGKEEYERDTLKSVKIKRDGDIINFSHKGLEGSLNISSFKASFFVDNLLDPHLFVLKFILMYLSPIFNATFIHASATVIGDLGIVGTGVSGSGKSTLAKTLTKLGGVTFHDEMTLIRKIDNNFYLFPLPFTESKKYVVNFQKPHKLTHLFFLGKTEDNHIEKLKTSKIYQNFFKVVFAYSNFENDYYGKILDFLDDLNKNVVIAKLNYNPSTLDVKTVENFKNK
jgi:uncharacterized protein YkvS